MSGKNSFENRIYKLSTGEKVSSADLEKLIEGKCHYVQYVAIGKDEKGDSVALIFPNKNLLNNPDYQLSPEEGCFCPRSLDELGRCLTGCLKLVNQQIDNDSSKVKSAAIINTNFPAGDETSITSQHVFDKYKALLHEAHGENVPADEEIYFIKNAQ
ncbi:MAG: hypothetical protein NT126_01105 [Bacteroidetes bacterium]|nr:hypothetical protein [Bacteroidota bacterium]